MAGDIFLLGTHAWQIRQVSAGVVRVADADGKPPTIPFWTGEAPARTAELSREVSALRSALDGYLAAGDADGARAWLAQAAPLDDAAVDQIVDYVAAGRAVLGVVPTATDLVFERFFDDAEGMHLVIHSPYGGRINRALGLALRKRFCKSFNFELQAAANDDAVVLSLGPHHSFPLADVPRFLNSNTVRGVLAAGRARRVPCSRAAGGGTSTGPWSCCAARAGGATRRPSSAWSPTTSWPRCSRRRAACQENITGPIEIPDHPLVRQTMHDTLTEGLDIDGLETLLDGIETGAVRVHFRDTTEASPFSHEILTAKPYAFLDDAEAVDRRTNAVPPAAGPARRPAHHRPARPRRRRPGPRRGRARARHAPTSCTTCCSAWWSPPRPSPWRPLFDELAARGRVRSRRRGRPGRRCRGRSSSGGPTELAARPRSLVDGRGRRHATPASRWPPRCCGATSTSPGPLTAAALAERCGPVRRRRSPWAGRARARRVRPPGPFTDPDARASPRRSSGAPGACWPACTPTPARRRRRAVEAGHRPGLHALPAALAARGPRHPAPRRATACAPVIEQLQGYEAGAATWEPEILRPPASTDYQPALLDRLCHDGEVTWLRLGLAAGARRQGGPRRGHSPLEPVQGDARSRSPSGTTCPGCSRRPAGHHPGGARRWAPPPRWSRPSQPRAPGSSPSWPPTPAGCPPTSRPPVGRGGPGPAHRRRLRRHPLPGRGTPPPAPPPHATRSAGSGGARPGPPRRRAAGRWSPTAEPSTTARRWPRWWPTSSCTAGGSCSGIWPSTKDCPCPGVNSNGLCAASKTAGSIRGGRFVAGFSGEQYALPAAMDGLKAIRRQARSGERVVINACDPLNLTGVIIRGPRTPAVRTNTITYIDGLPEDQAQACDNTANTAIGSAPGSPRALPDGSTGRSPPGAARPDDGQ